jgi:hypothetical protein
VIVCGLISILLSSLVFICGSLYSMFEFGGSIGFKIKHCFVFVFGVACCCFSIIGLCFIEGWC